MEVVFFWEQRLLCQRAQSHRDGNKNVASTSLRVVMMWGTSVSSPWFLDPGILAVREAVLFLGHEVRAYTPFCKTLPQPRKGLSFSWCHKWAFKKPFHCSTRPAVTWEHGQISKFCELEDYFRIVTKAFSFLTWALCWGFKARAYYFLFLEFFSTAGGSQLTPRSL